MLKIDIEKHLAFVVLDRSDRVVGIVSERDIIRAIATSGGQSLGQPVSNIMTREVFSADPGETIEGERLVGIVSIGDLVKAKIAATEYEAQTLKAYITAG